MQLESPGPAHELFDLTTGGADLDDGDFIFSFVDGHRRVRCLVGSTPITTFIATSLVVV